MCRRIIWILCLAGLTASGSFAQTGDEARAEINFAAGIPQGDFEDGLDATPIGATAFIGGRVPNLPLVLGTELGFLNYGSSSELAIYSTALVRGGDQPVPVEALSVSSSSNIVLGHLVARLQAPTGRFQPYVDALVGLKYFITRVDIDSDIIVFRNGLSQDSHARDVAFSYGVGGGIELLAYELPSMWDGSTVGVSLHAGVRYLFGGEADYVRPEGAQTSDGRIVFTEERTRTDLLLPQFGIRIQH